ncbi:MAG: rod shape-determining protein MreD [Actinomycetota bacterium]|nr:rod shape-determining protein MreD [Actinomycetota bacterium]
MIITRQISIRLVLIVVVCVLVQLSFFSYFAVLGAQPEVIPVVVAAIGLLGGAVTGGVVGFATGLLLDAALLQTMGVSSLILLSVGYLAGRYRESFEIDSPLGPALVAGALTLLSAAGFVALQVMLGVEAQVSGLIVREVVMKGIIGFLLAYPIYPLIRFMLRPALVLEDSPSRRPLFRGRRSKPAARRSRRMGAPGEVA